LNKTSKIKTYALISLTLILTVIITLGIFSYHSYAGQLEVVKELVTPFSFELFERAMEIRQEHDIKFYATGIDSNRIYDEGEIFNVSALAPMSGNYIMKVKYLPSNMAFEHNLIGISVNGIKTDEMTGIFLPSRFVFADQKRRFSNKGVQIYPEQFMIDFWEEHILRVGRNEHRTDPLVIFLNEGLNEIEIQVIEGNFTLDYIGFESYVPLVSYSEYASGLKDSKPGSFILLEAEHFYYKNDNNISIVSSTDINVSPYDSRLVKLNVIDAGTFQENMNRLAYFIEIQEAGFYYLGLKAGMPGKNYMPVFVDIELNGKIPFAEFNGLRLPYNKQQTNHIFTETPVFLTEGIHEIAITINAEVYYYFSRQINDITKAINELSLDLLRITGNNQDRNREWDLTEFLPDMVNDLISWRSSLEVIESGLLGLSDDRSNEEIQKIRRAISQLNRLINDPNSTPSRMNVLSQGPTSAFALLADAYMTLNVQALSLDQIIIKGTGYDGVLPVVSMGLSFRVADIMKQFISTFANETVRAAEDDPYTIDVWIRRSSQYYNLLELMIDSYFTEQTGIKVNLSLVPEESAITLANAANRQPDVMINVSANYVNDLGLRGALTDLKVFPGAGQIIKRAAPGTLRQMTIDNKLYGIPENQDINIMFYRSDIFEALGFEVPNTWDEVLLLLPQLQRNGMNFATELSMAEAMKPWTSTMPFYALHQANIFSDDGMRTTIDSREGLQAMRYMTDLFKIYGMPLRVQSFYNDFRAGRVPIGISGFGTYVRLTFAAPEIAGLWNIALMPGMYNNEGELERWTSGGVGNGAVVIFEGSQKKDAAWQFISWFLSTDVQYEYMIRMQSTYGREFIYPSGNLDVFSQLPISRAHREIFATQSEWIIEAPRVPGGYSVEREVSNAWNRVIHNDIDVKTAVDEAAVIANREIRRRLEEFGYVDINGNMLRPFIVPSLQDIREWDLP